MSYDACGAACMDQRIADQICQGAPHRSFDGEHHEVHGLDGLPKPVQQPHPPLFVGGAARPAGGPASPWYAEPSSDSEGEPASSTTSPSRHRPGMPRTSRSIVASA